VSGSPQGALTLLGFLAVAGCSKGAGDAAPPASTAMAAAPSAPSAAGNPRMKETAAPPADRVGVLAPGTGIVVGQKVPDVHGHDLDGKDVTLASLYTWKARSWRR
jgi:hypothetical protein